jgi:hypothetical protein
MSTGNGQAQKPKRNRQQLTFQGESRVAYLNGYRIGTVSVNQVSMRRPAQEQDLRLCKTPVHQGHRQHNTACAAGAFVASSHLTQTLLAENTGHAPRSEVAVPRFEVCRV